MTDEPREYLSIDSSGEDEKCDTITNLIPIEVLNTLTPNELPPHKLMLKIGTIVIILRNINLERDLYNGTRLKVIKMGSFSIHAQVLTGNYKNEIVILPRITLSPSNEEIPFQMSRKQFPIRLGFALTINKSQG
ncbi:ATP-dependent DNA helicase PIF1-like [Leptopilina boulardi]|uniref:ATP-dependent DNA helicase PIF1-like n=1 Tax=Leptopilina boulardi TaxID=63433 RepID=UPI0021F5AECE|nr:ATP-dependent DNA helicase PIF1-like [Leptopilina boulardi]